MGAVLEANQPSGDRAMNAGQEAKVMEDPMVHSYNSLLGFRPILEGTEGGCNERGPELCLGYFR